VIPDILWRMPDERVYLTFDDGPDERVTPALLDLLDQHELKATFFVVGSKAERLPGIVARMRGDGHAIGNHSFTHAKLLWRTGDFVRAEVARTSETIRRITGQAPALFRPPFGRFGVAALRAAEAEHLQLVLWNASTRDYRKNATPERIQRRLRRQARPGAIILLHDGHRNSQNTLAALRRTLAELPESAVQFAALPENR